MYLDSPDTDLCDPADIDELKLPSHLRLKDDTERHWPCGTPCEALPPDARLLVTVNQLGTGR